MGFRPEKQDNFRARRDLPNRLREPFQLFFRLLARQFDMDEIEPAAGHHCDRAGETQGQDATQARLHRQPTAFSHAAQEHCEAGIGG